MASDNQKILKEMVQNRNTALDVLKFFAVLLITNSHFDNQYVYAKDLATGGAIGDALFFFVSGYSLFLGRVGRFDSWYKRRIRRIYPSVFSLAIITSIFGVMQYDMIHTLLFGGEWFVTCIMLYYVVLYLIRKYFVEYLNLCYMPIVVLLLVWYVFFYNHADYVYIYKNTYIKWLFYFIYMLLGAQCGWNENNGKLMSPDSFLKVFILLLLEICVFYGIQIFCRKYMEYNWLMILSLLPLVGICLNFYKFCNLTKVKKIFLGSKVGKIMAIIGSLCLEIYLVQPFVRTTVINFLFPLNLIIIFFAIVIAAYVVRAIGKIFQQTFSSEDGYQWREILKLK